MGAEAAVACVSKEGPIPFDRLRISNLKVKPSGNTGGKEKKALTYSQYVQMVDAPCVFQKK